MSIYKRYPGHIRLLDATGRQYGAAVGMKLAHVLGRELTLAESRMWRRHGIIKKA